MTTYTLNIVQGPSKFELMLALFDAEPDRKVVFGIARADAPRMEASITGVERCSERQGEVWNITGFIRSGDKRDQHLSFKRFQGFYKTDRRTGTFEVQKNAG